MSTRLEGNLLGTQRLQDIRVGEAPGNDAPRPDAPQVRADFLRSGAVEGIVFADVSECD